MERVTLRCALCAYSLPPSASTVVTYGKVHSCPKCDIPLEIIRVRLACEVPQ
jgi:hypothetical protein